MSFLDKMRGGKRADGASTEPDLSDADQDLTDRYAKLNEREALEELGRLNQVELTAVEQFERDHRGRDSVLNKLRYLRQPEPMPGYDTLEPAAITEALAGADASTIKSVREYERKIQNRPAVNKEVSDALHRRNAADGPADEPAHRLNAAGEPLASQARQAEAASAAEPVPASDNGLPIKVPPESGLGTP